MKEWGRISTQQLGERLTRNGHAEINSLKQGVLISDSTPCTSLIEKNSSSSQPQPLAPCLSLDPPFVHFGAELCLL
jgi:hypothetical protein